jgi:adenine phosphoribosyltransferase
MVTLEEKVRSAIRIVPDFPQTGVMYKDITTFFKHPLLLREVIDDASRRLAAYRPEALAAVESRGFLMAVPIALQLGIPLVMLRKKGKLPLETLQESYELEYGSATLEMHRDELSPGMRVALTDDVLATGGTAEAAARLIRKAGAEAVAAWFLVDLTHLGGQARLREGGLPVLATVSEN